MEQTKQNTIVNDTRNIKGAATKKALKFHQV